jgi:hypothetical protein
MRKFDKRIHGKKKNLLEHLQKTPSERAPRHLSYYQPIGKHVPGRPRRR